MKSITLFIKENNQSIDIFKDIDINNFEWQSAYSDDDYQKKCKGEVKEFANELYKDIKPYKRIEQLFRDSYKQYLSINKKLSKEKIDEQYNHQIEIINKQGWGQLESYSLEQGWWVFMNWIKTKINTIK